MDKVSVLKLDRKGRTVIKKDVLTRAGLQTPCNLLATVRDDGVIELKPIGSRLARAIKIGREKLRGWKEEEHRGEKLLFGMTEDATH